MEQNWIPSKSQKDELLKLSKLTIEGYLKSREIPKYKTTDSDFLHPSAVFVTLTINQHLRGCVGGIIPQDPLYLAVQKASISAAFGDPRFPPLQKKELDFLEVKIAILSKLMPLSPVDIEVGTHGLMIEHNGKRGLLLPEVAAERNWSVDTFLENLCLKANLPPLSWKTISPIFGFTTIIIQET
jgi:AmmeMemoRadiSam system protein A